MPVLPAPGEKYTIRRKVFKIFGAAFHIYDDQGQVVGYCKQAAFKLKEDLRIYTDESMGKELMRIAARNIIDFSATYDIKTPDGHAIGSARQKGLKSAFVRDEWLVFDAAGTQIATLQEEGGVLAFLRHWVELISALSPQTYTMTHMDRREVARYRQHFNPFVFRMGVTTGPGDDEHFDDLVVLAVGCLIAAIEGRQAN